MNKEAFSPQKEFRHTETVHPETLVLFIHGITEGPEQFRELMEELSALHYDSIALVLPGHGGSAKDFSDSSGTAWSNYVNSRLDDLREQYASIFLIGHSMGGLLAINAYCHNPQSISGIITIGCPIRVWVAARAIRSIIGYRYFPDHHSREHIALQNAVNVAPGPTLGYLRWIPRLKDLFRMIDETRRNLPAIHIPLLVIQGMLDELVNAKGSLAYFRKHTGKNFLSTLELPDTTHFVYAGNDKGTMHHTITAFISNLTRQKPDLRSENK